ncbi:hypothetical protein C0J52_21572 [Blattella germanica]|nr:hypothetical protein C0J52_21572 [Blattella germanica]
MTFSHGLEERSFTDGINATVTQIENIAKGILAPIEQGIDRTISDARKIITESSARAEEIVNTVIKVAQNLSANFIAGIEANLNKAMESGKNVSACEAKSLQGAAVIVNATDSESKIRYGLSMEPLLSGTALPSSMQRTPPGGGDLMGRLTQRMELEGLRLES